jgi:tRNA threonylcarbamoyladenosine biosynthesis protein TsaE
MRTETYTAASEEEMIALGAMLAAGWPCPSTVLLIGNLGAGKTTLAKGIAEGLGASRADDVSSPTFPLIHEYGEDGQMYHVDLYRLDTEAEVAALGLEEILARPAVTVMEWAERFPALLPEERIEIRIEVLAGEGRRLEVLHLP